MEKEIKLKYNNREITIQLPSKYKQFTNLLEDKLYLTPDLMKCATISYYDSEGDKNTLSDEEYDLCLNDNNGDFELEIDYLQYCQNNQINDDIQGPYENDGKIINNKKIDKNEIKNIEKKIADKCVKIFKQKLQNKDLEHKNEISTIKLNFENTMTSMIESNKNQIDSLLGHFNNKMKENFTKYNDMIIKNIDEGILKSDLNKLTEQFINNNQFSQLKNNIDDKNDEQLEFSLIK